jgi:hypothetical protein
VIARQPEDLRAPCPGLDKKLDGEIPRYIIQAGEEAEEDPRDIPLRKLDKIIFWALSNAPWQPREREILQALFLEDGDCQAVSRIFNVELGLVERMMIRARSELIMAARQRDWAEGFAHTRLSGKWPHKVTTMQLDDGRIWFIEAGGEFREVEV